MQQSNRKLYFFTIISFYPGSFYLHVYIETFPVVNEDQIGFIDCW